MSDVHTLGLYITLSALIISASLSQVARAIKKADANMNIGDNRRLLSALDSIATILAQIRDGIDKG